MRLRVRGYEPKLGQPFAPFEIYDPFGLRNAIVPVFCLQVDGRMYGVGIAFHVDGFGNFLTAYHVIDFVEKHLAGRLILFASLRAADIGSGVRPPQTLPMRTNGWVPQVGEIMLAVGFPELDISEVDQARQSALLTEGMYGAYGRIVAVHEQGTTTPVKASRYCSRWPLRGRIQNARHAHA